MIINLRGTSGSGKTYVTTKLIELMNGQPIIDEWTGRCTGHLLDSNVRVIGDYPGGCGGCDKIKTVGEVEERVREAAKIGHVLFEGLILSTIYKRWADMARELPFVWAFMDTSMEQCLANVTKRNQGKPFNHDNIAGKWLLNQQHKAKALENGFHVIDISMDDGHVVLRNLLTGTPDVSVTIRCATKADHKTIVKLGKQTPYTKDFSNELMFSSQRAYDLGWIKVAEKAGQIVGFICVRQKVRFPETMVYFLGVDKECRRSGIGKLLLESIERSSDNKYTTLNVDRKNADAQLFFKREGFEIDDAQPSPAYWRLYRENRFARIKDYPGVLFS